MFREGERARRARAMATVCTAMGLAAMVGAPLARSATTTAGSTPTSTPTSTSTSTWVFGARGRSGAGSCRTREKRASALRLMEGEALSRFSRSRGA